MGKWNVIDKEYPATFVAGFRECLGDCQIVEFEQLHKNVTTT